DARPCPFRVRAGAAVAAAEADGATELAGQEITFDLGLCHALGIAVAPRLLDVLVDLAEPPSVRVFGVGVEHDAGIAGVRASLDRHEVEGVELAAGSAEKASK